MKLRTMKLEQVDCRNFVPGTDQVPRPHCDMGDGREGDCPIYLKQEKTCKFRCG